jgi:heat shock protein HtpX
MKRILLFLATNVAILVVLSVVIRMLGLETVLDERGVDLDLGALLALSAVVGFVGSFVSLLISKFVAKRMTGAVVIQEPRTPAEQFLVERVGLHAKAAGIGMPEVAIFDSPAPNAFATGARRNSALVAVSTGLLGNMNRDEVDAVLAHEIGHVANGDMVTLALIQGVVNTFVFFLSRVIGHVIDRVVFRTERGHGPAYFVTAILAQIVLGILASAIVMWFSRQREFRADQEGARLSGRENMIAALRRLKSGQANAVPLPEQLDAFGISSGGRRNWAELFASHPSLDDRIAALQSAGT